MANAKAQISGQSTGLTTEDAVLAASGLLNVFDPDPGQSFAASRSNSAAKFGWWSVAADGTWQYLLDNTNASVQALGAGKTLTDSFTVTSLDGSASKAVTITITGTNDTAVISGKTSGSVAEDKTYQTFGTVIVSDRDNGEAHTQAVWNGVAAHGTWSVDGKGNWTYKLNNADAAVQGLAAGETMTDSFAVTSQDGSASQIITITITGANDVPVITGQASGQVVEDSGAVAIGTLIINDKDHDQSHSQAAAGNAKYGSWTVDADGHWNYQLDNTNAKVQALGAGKTLTDSFVVTSQDGTAHKTVTVTIVGSNDVASIVGQTSGHVTENTALKATGTVTVSDIDSGEAHSKATSNAAATYGTWSVDSNGHWTYQLDKLNPVVVALPIGQTLTDSFAITSQDGSASQTVTISIAGANHVATITGNAGGLALEDSSQPLVDYLTVQDPDAGQSQMQAVSSVASTYGHWSVEANGRWSYVLDSANPQIQALGAGEKTTDSFTVHSLDGSATKTVTITIVGRNDAPSAQDAVASGDEDHKINGQLTAVDVDSGDHLIFQLAPNGGPAHGSVTIETDGSYSYTPDANYNGSDSFNYMVIDGQGVTVFATVHLTINAVDDAPTTPVDVDGVENFVVVGAAAGTAVGITVHASDIDSPTLTYSLTDDAGGRFQIDSHTGVISVANGANLAAGSYSVTAVASDGLAQSAPQNFTIDVSANNNHAPELVGKDLAFVALTNDGWSLMMSHDGGLPQQVAVIDSQAMWQPETLVQADGKVYCITKHGDNGISLWSYDIQSHATEVTDISANISANGFTTQSAYLTSLDGKLYFRAQDAVHGEEIWVYDAQSKQSSVIDVVPGADGSNAAFLTVCNGKLYFNGADAAFNHYLMAYDPQSGAVTKVPGALPGMTNLYPSYLTVVDGKLLFTGYTSSFEPSLWQVDPVTGEQKLLANLSSYGIFNLGYLASVDGKLYFMGYDNAHGGELWVYDPTTQAAHITTDIYPGFYGSSPEFVTAVGGKLLFAATDTPDYKSLWVYDPTTGTSHKVDGINMTGASQPNSFSVIGDKLYFQADDGVHGRELWVYDPQSDHASLVADLKPDHSVWTTATGVELDGKLYFQGNDSGHGNAIFAYDPASNIVTFAAGTQTANKFAYATDLTPLGGKLYFAAYHDTFGRELFVYDPQTHTTSLAADIAAGQAGSSPSSLVALDGKLYFAANDGTHGSELWTFDPTTSHATLLADLVPGSSGSNPAFLTVLNGKLYFAATDSAHGSELWAYDPATNTSGMVAELNAGTSGSNPIYLTAVDGRLFFTAYDQTHGTALRCFDPATQTASLVLDAGLGPVNVNVQGLTALDGKLYFSAWDNAHGAELWVCDPVNQTASIAAEIAPGNASSSPLFLTALGGKLYFAASEGSGNDDVWVYDPATHTANRAGVVTPGAQAAEYISAVDGKLLIGGYGQGGEHEIYIFDPVTKTTIKADAPDGMPNSSLPGPALDLSQPEIVLPVIDPDGSGNPGATVATLLAGHVSDVDANAQLGIAVVGADNSHGEWQYSLDSGAHWLTLPAVTDHAATLLDGGAKLRFVPEANWIGQADIVVRAWDQTDGHHSGDSGVDISVHGGTSAYSSNTVPIDIHVTQAIVTGTESADTLNGTNDADIINGLGGDDHINGHGGNDTITGGKGDDILDGGAGADTFIFNVGDGHDTIVAGGYDNADTIKLLGGTFYDLNFTFDGNDLLVAQAIDQNYNFDDTGYIRLQDFLTGSEHSITVQIDTGSNNTFYGTDADLSTIVFHYGTEGLNNASTGEVLIGTSGDDVINGNGGYYDALYGGDGNDTINGGDGVDWIRGGNGDDTLYGGKGNDRYDGGAGADTFLFNVGDGIDQIRVGGYDSQDTIKLLGTNLYDINFGRSGQDLWVAQAVNANHDRNDTGYIELRQFLDGSAGHINVQIDAGHDTNLLYGTDASHATLTFQQGLEGSDNTDHAEIIIGTNGDDVINGNGGYYDGLYGYGGNDIINGGYGVDHLIGGSGDDVLHGFGGNDLLRGESGNDTLDGGTGIDTADYRYAADGIVADLSTGHASNDGDGGQDSFISIENVTGSDHNDTITGDAGDNQLDGRAGDDVLIGGGGADVLIGGSGADKFVYQSASESTLSHLDVISDFNHSEGDSIDLSALGLTGGIVNGGTIGAFGNAPQVDFGGNGLIIETDGANTRIYADSDHSGHFNVATDLVVQLTGNHLNEIVTQPASIVT
jgi:VCBS repeat-containing protein/ELWxxDGT repeat protein